MLKRKGYYMRDLKSRVWVLRLYISSLVTSLTAPGVFKFLAPGFSPDLVLLFSLFFVVLSGFFVLVMWHLSFVNSDLSLLPFDVFSRSNRAVGVYWFFTVCLIAIVYADDPIGDACFGIALGVLGLLLIVIFYAEYYQRKLRKESEKEVK